MGYTGGDYGTPDLLVGYRGRTILIEVKNPNGGKPKSKRSKGSEDPPENAKGQLTPTQVEWFREWPGGEAHVVETAGDAVRIVKGADLPCEISVSPEDDGVALSSIGRNLAWMKPDEADALAGALHEQAGVARATGKRIILDEASADSFSAELAAPSPPTTALAALYGKKRSNGK
jgi:hypothetical protein